MPIFEEEKILDLPVEGQNIPKPALGSPAYAPYPSPPALSSAGMLFGGAGREGDDFSRRGLTNDQLSKIATMPSKDTGPNLIPLSEVAANKRYNTYVRGVDLENIYGLQQSWYEQLGNSAIKFAGLTAGTFAQSFATIPNMISAAKSGTAAERLARLSGDPDGYEAKIDNWTRNMEDIFPNYMTRRERENPLMGIIPFMPGSANFWGESILKNLGFTAGAIAGAIAQDAIIGAVTGGVGALPVAAAQIGKASLWLNKIFAGTNKIDAALDLGRGLGASSKAILSAKNLGQAAEGIRTLDKVRYGMALMGASRTEAAVEARDSYRVLKDELTKEYVKKNGVEPEGEALREIESYATAGMNTRFGVNMALLTLSNTIQFGNMFKAFTTSSSQFANTITRNIDDLGSVRLKNGSLDVFEKVAPETKIGKIWESVRPTLKNVFAEGVYEEGGQFAAEKGVYNYYTRKYKNLSNPDNANNWNSLNETVDSTLKGLNEQFGSGEGVQNMVVGAITALITGKAMGAIQKKMGVPTDDEKLQSTLSILNNYGLTGVLSQQYSDVATSAGIAKEMDEAVKEGNIFKYNNLKKDMFFNYVTSRIPIGMHDVTIEQLKMLKTLDKEEFEKTFGMSFDASNKKTVNDYVDSLILQANQIKDITDSLDATFKNPFSFNINAKQDTKEYVDNINYQTFNNWKRDLAYYAYEGPSSNQRIASIQQSLGNINPALSTELLSNLTSADGLKSLSKEYEEEAARIEKGITEGMPVATAREIRANARTLRTLSERINLALNNNNANDAKLFNDVLNFELNNHNPKAESIIGLEKATELFNYGVDINYINNRKRIAKEKYEYLSTEKGFFEYMEQEEQVNEDLQEEIPEAKPEEAALPPAAPKYKDVAGAEQPIEQGRTYEIAPFKKPTINKIADNRYEVVSPDGKSTFYNNEEDAKEALDELSQKLKALESVKVLAFNPDGTIKIEDINGDVYNIPAGSLDGYSKKETEQEKLARNKEEIDNAQSEIENNSPTIATEEYPLKEGYQIDVEAGSTTIDEIDFKKSFQHLFWSTTSASEVRDVDSKKPHAVRAITFLQRAKEFPNRGALRVMLVTPYQEEALGLRGITKLSTGEDPKSNITDFDNEVIFAVYVEQKDGKLSFVGQDGNTLGAVGDQVDMDKVVFNTMPTTALTWGAGGLGKARYRGKQEREAKIMSARWGVKRKEMFEATKEHPSIPEIYSFQVSPGIPVIDSMEDKNPIAKSLFDPNLKNGDKIIRNEEGLLQVSTTGLMSHQGRSYIVPKGQLRISYGDMLAPAVNNKLGKSKATAIFEVLKAMAEDMMEKSKKKEKIKFPIDYEQFIINTLYWRKSPDTKKSNQIFIDEQMNIVIGGTKYDITNLESYRKEIIDNLSDGYHIVNNKSLGSVSEGGVSKFRLPFIEFFVDKDGKLQNREWTNYQTYLLSDKFPDGSARSSSEIPVTTFIRIITDEIPYNFVQKYSILQPTEFVNLPIPAEEKKSTTPPPPPPPPTPTAPAKIVVDGNEVVADGKTLNTSTKAFKSGSPVQYTITIDGDGKVKSVIVNADNQTSNTIKDVAENPAMLQAVDNALKQGNAYDEKLSPLARVALFAASKIKLYFQQELAKAPAPTAAPLSDIEKVVITDENYNNWSNVRDRSDYQAFVDQVKSTLAMFDQVPDKSKITPETVEQMLSTVKAFSNKAIRDRVVPLIVAKYKTSTARTEPVVTATEAEADIERKPVIGETLTSDSGKNYIIKGFSDRGGIQWNNTKDGSRGVWSKENFYKYIKEGRLKYDADSVSTDAKADIEKAVLGSFANTTERVVKSKGPNNGRTVRTELTSKISSDGEVIVFKSKNTFTDNGNSVITSSASMTIEEFKEHFYPMFTAEEIEMFEELLEVYKEEGWNGTIYFKELRVGSSKATNLKGQVNLDIMIGPGNDFGFTLTKRLTDAELAALEGAKPTSTTDARADIEYRRNRNKEQKNEGAPVMEGENGKWLAYYTPEKDKGYVSFDTQKEALKWIDDKYNAELAALKETKPAAAEVSVTPTAEDQKKLIRDIIEEEKVTVTDSQIDLLYDALISKGELTEGFVINVLKTGGTKARLIIDEINDLGIKPAEAPAVEEVVPVKKNKGGKFKKPDSPAARVIGKKEKEKPKISEYDIELFKQYHSEVAPNVPYEIAERIFILHNGERAYGVFEKGVAKFYKGAIRGTEYHELFEGIWKAFLTSEERQEILDELKALPGTFTDRASGKKLRWDEATDKDIKERIADDFAEYRLGKLPARTLLEKIVRFFRNIINYFRNMVSAPQSRKDKLFRDIDAGRFKDFRISDEVRMDEMVEASAVEGLIESDVKKIVQDISARIFSYIFSNNKSLFELSKITNEEVYNHVKSRYIFEDRLNDEDPDALSTKQFNEVFQRVYDFIRTFRIEFDDENLASVNDSDANNRSYAPEPFSTDWKKQSPYPVKLLLGTLIKTDPTAVDALTGLAEAKLSEGIDGFQLIDFGRAFAMMLDKLSNTTSIKDFGKKLSQIAKFSTDYGRLLVRLKTNKETGFIDFESMSLDDMRLFIQAFQTFAAKQKPVALIQYVSGDAVRTGAANLFTAVKEKKEDWLSNLRMIAKDKESIVKYDADKKTYFVKDLKGIPISNVEEKIEFLKKLGIEFPMSTYVKLKSVKEPTERRSDRDKFGDAVNSIYQYVGDNEGIGTISGKTLKVDGPLSTLATLYVSYENPAQETTRFNVENKRVNEYAENNLPSVFENDFSESATLEELKARRPELNDVFTTHSVILKKGGLFYDEDGERIGRIKVGYIEGEKDTLNSKNTTTARLSESDRLVLQLNQNINGRYYILLPADGSTEWLLSIGNIISYDKIVAGRAWDELYKIFQGYLKDEIALAKSDRSYIQHTAPRAKELRFFKEILSEDLLKKANALIFYNATKNTIDKFIENKSSEINNAVKSFIEDKMERVKNDLVSNKKVKGTNETGWSFDLLDSDFAEQFKIDKNNITAEELNNILMFANMNYIIANTEMHKILFGDPYQFKIKDNILDEFKRIKSSLSPRRTVVDSPEINNKLNKELNKLSADITLTSGTPGYHKHDSYVTTSTLSDVNIVGSLANVNPSYVKTNETDGFSIIMDGTYREVKEKNGQWTPQANAWHNWQMSYTRKKFDEKGIWTYPKDGKLKAYDEKMLSKPAPAHMIEVLKPIVTGNKGNRNTFDQVLDKFSQMPMYYSMVEGTNLEDLYIKMWKENIGYVVYESGRKEGVERNVHSVYLNDGKFNPKPFNNRIEVPWKAYGVQVETSYDDFKEDVSMGSQPTKIISIDLFENGVPVSAKAGDEYRRNLNILNEIHRNAYYQFLKKIGLEDLGDGFKIVDRKALSESLEYEILRRELSQNVADTVRLNKDGQFPIPFEASNSYVQIRDVIFSMINKALISKKMHGGAFVQVPVTGWENKGEGRSLVKKVMVYNNTTITTEEYEKLSKEEKKNVKFRYDKISTAEYEKLSNDEKKLVSLTSDKLKMPTPDDPFMEVMLPHWFREKLPSKLKRMTDDQLLSYLNTTEDGKKLLQAFGFRIPTQALSSMSAIRVAGFLPQYMGYTVVVPSEITTMAGSDFDIDKMFIYLKSYYIDKNDNIRLVKYLDSEEATKEFFTNLYESRMKDELDKITKFDEFRKKLIDIFNSIQQLDDTSLEQLETLSDEDFEFYTNHAVLINEIIDQAEEEQTTPKDYILEQIKRLGDKKEKFTNKLLNTDLKKKYVERMYRRALENEYFDSMIKLITLPEAYDRLISPVDDAGLKDVAGEIEKLRGDSELDEKGNPRVKGRLLDMSFMNNLRHAFITANRWVGIGAVNITGLSVAQKSRVYIDTKKLSYLDDADKKFLGDGSIALPHNKVTIDGRTYTSFSGTKTADGKGRYISSRLSGYLTTFVDVAKDPYIMKIIRSELLTSTAMFLERIGAGESTAFFINQPIIVEYVKYLENNGIKSLFSKTGLEMVETMFPASQTAIENASIDVSIDAMKDNIESYYKKGTFTEEQNAKQLLIFKEFLKYAKMAQHSFKLNMATNYDTSKFRSAGILIRKIFRTQSAKRKNIFSSVDDILNNSHIGLQAEFIESAVMATGEYLQLNKPEILENVIIPVLEPYIENEYLNEEDFMRMEMMVTSSFLDYLQQTKTGINEEVRMLTTDESTSVAKMLRDAKVKYPDNELLQNLSVRQNVEGGAMTIKLLANNKSSGIDENYYIGMMRELRDNPDTEALYRGLVKLSIVQGSYQSAVSIKNIIPVEDYSNLLKDKLMDIRYSAQEMDAFKNGMFHRNNWKNERVFKRAHPAFWANTKKEPIYNADGEPMYEYFSLSFPIVPTISAERKKNLILTLSTKYNFKQAGSEYVLVDRFLKIPKTDLYVDIATGESYSMSDYRRLIAKGNLIAKQVYGYQLVRYQDGTPVVTYDKNGVMSYVYKLINLYGDSPNVYEYYKDFIESKIPNNSMKIKNEVDNDLIYKYYEGVNEKKNPKAPAKQEQVDDAPFDVDEAVETTSVSTIRKEIQPGFYNHGFLSKEDEKIILDEAIKQTNQQGYPVKSSVVYAHWGNMWAVTDKGADAFPVFGKYLKRSEQSAGLGKGLKKIDLPKSNIQHNDGGKGWYDYYPTDQNGKPLAPIPQVVKDILEKKLGMDMSVYDSAIINSYGETTELSRHIDNTEDKGYAYKIPIVSISLIGDSVFQYSSPSDSSTHSLPDDKSINLKPGQVVVFGGPSRAMAHRVLNGRSGASVNIKNSVGSLQTERINITLRRALPLSKDEYDAWMRRSEELKQEAPQAAPVKTTTPAPTPLTSMSEITNHSGGAALSDTEWDQIGREYGVIKHFHYREPLDYIDTKGEPAKGSKTLDSKRLQAAGITPTYISQKDYDEGAAKATKAFRMMYKDSEYKSVRSAYIIRNWMQVKNADAVFAIGTIKQPGENASDKADETRIAAIPIVKGGTGYAVQMAINEGKPVYVFDGTKAGWYKYDYNSKTFIPTETPILTKNFAGIGSRTLGTQEVINKSIQAIRDVYEQTKNSISTAPTAPVEAPVTETKTFEEFGTQYRFTLENGVAVKGEFKQGGKDWQEMNPKNVGKKYTELSQKPIVETPPVEEPLVVTEDANKFKFNDGTEVDVPFKLNAEQRQALLKLEEFSKNPKKFDGQITLLGYAGTGKTSIISIFDTYLKKKYIRPVYTSPTHRANAVTKQKNPTAKVVTLHSLFGLGPEIKLDEGDYDIRDLEFASKNKPKIMGGETLIVDESSLVSSALYDFLERFKKNLNINIIYVGDPAQLKPVRDKDISPVFTKGTKLQLTKVERTGDNPILRESTNLRNGQDFSYTTDFAPSGGVEYINNIARVNQVIGENFSSQAFKDNPLFFRVLSGTNVVADEYNRVVRDLLFNTTEQIVEGDVLMGNNNFDLDYVTQEPLIVNSGDYKVESVRKGERKIRTDKGEIVFSGYNVSLINLMNPSDNKKNVFIVDNNESKDKIFKFVDAVAAFNIQGAKAKASGNMKLAAAMFSQAKSLESQLAFMKSLEDANGKIKVKKTLGYGYAHTIHKSQGGTYNRVMILDSTIDVFKDPATRQQLKYVAMSRASEMVYVATNQPVKEAAPSEPSAFDLLTEFTPERKQEILSNFASKHRMTIEKAKDYINEAIATKGKEIVITQLNKTDEQGNKCY